MNLTLSWRNIWRNKTRSLIIVTSVAIGLFAGVFVLGLYDGILQARVRNVIESEVGHLQIHQPHFKDDYDPAMVLEIGSPASALRLSSIKSMARRSITQGMLATATGSAGVQVIGVVPHEENPTSGLDKKVAEGGPLNPQRMNGVLVGKKLADKMKLRVGSRLVLTLTDRESNITSGAFRVTGIYQTNNDRLDEKNVYVHLATLNAHLGIVDGYHELAILLKSDRDLALTQSSLQQQFPSLEVRNWKENSPDTDLMVSTMNQYSAIIIIIIMIALAFGIVNTMLMSVLERTREIGMLAALGMNRVRVFLLILSETALLTTIGVPVGMLSAWLVINYFSRVGIDISSYSGAAMSGFGFSSTIYPEFPKDRIVTVLLIVVVTALISSLFPSIKAIRLQPADALRQ